MNRVQHLLKAWAQELQTTPRVKNVTVKLSAQDYARIRALTEIYPDRSEEQILSELLSAMLDEVEEALPYIPGKSVVAEDEFGDPVYEDIGLSRKFEQLKQKFAKTG
ncbi:MAG: type 1 pili tip component [Gammaproteobacteria bacterium]|nr:type 1 pili tip component [Gammaproteobacteria bacterium]